MAFHMVNCCETVRKLVWALSVLSSDDVWLFGRLGDKLAERQEARGDLDLDRPVPIDRCDVCDVCDVRPWAFSQKSSKKTSIFNVCSTGIGFASTLCISLHISM